METKICTKCKATKTLDEFPPDKKHRDGRASWCRVCGRLACKRWAKNHKESIAQRRIRNKDKIVRYGKNRWAAKKEHISAINREWAKRNPEKMKEYGKAWRERDIEHARELGRKAAEKRSASATGRLSRIVSNGMRQTLKKGSKGRQHWEDLVGYSVNELKEHLEKQFLPSMTWENHGTYWHIDHRIPVIAFNFATVDDIDFIRCWSLDNLRPLEKFQNQSKGAKIIAPFQPSLAMAI